MEPIEMNKEKRTMEPGHHTNPLHNEISEQQIANNEKAHVAAERDMDSDADLSIDTNPEDDLDEGETARLGEDLRNII